MNLPKATKLIVMNTLTAIMLTVVVAIASWGETAMASNEGLSQLFDEHWEYTLQRWPTSATYNGDHRFDDKLHDVSAKAYENEAATLRTFLSKLDLFHAD